MSVDLRLARRIGEIEQQIQDVKTELMLSDGGIKDRLETLEGKTAFDALTVSSLIADELTVGEAQTESLTIDGIRAVTDCVEIISSTNVD